jgi:signal transduction histidine kinase
VLTSHTLEIGGPAARPPTARHRVQTGWRLAGRTGGDGGLHPASTRAPARIRRPRRYRRDVLSLITDRYETTRHGPAGGAANMPTAIKGVRVLVLVVMLVTVPLASPHPGLTGPRSIAILVGLVVSALAWVVWLRAGSRYRLLVTALAVMAVAGGALAGLSPFSTAIAVGCVVTSSAGIRLSTEASLTITAATVAAFLIAGFTVAAPAETLAGYPAALIGLWAFGLTRRAYLLRAEEAEEALEQARRAHAAENQAAALAERARIAREIHDVLAHSLAAVSVNLQAAEGLLGELPVDSRGSEVVKAMECIERAVAFTRDGMTETRRAILALREGSDAGDGRAAPTTGSAPTGGPAPTRLVAELRKLTDDFRADGDAVIDLELIGEPRPVGAEAALTAYRTAQEALTNARKHAPGQPVTVGLTFASAQLEARIVNPLPATDGAGPLAGAGAGYGLTGLRERAALAGGTLTAGPEDGQWSVHLRIPA